MVMANSQDTNYNLSVESQPNIKHTEKTERLLPWHRGGERVVRSEDTKKQMGRMSNLKTNVLEATVTKQRCVGNPAERESDCSSHGAATSRWVCTDGDVHLPRHGNLSEKSVWIPQHPVLYLKYTQSSFLLMRRKTSIKVNIHS